MAIAKVAVAVAAAVAWAAALFLGLAPLAARTAGQGALAAARPVVVAGLAALVCTAAWAKLRALQQAFYFVDAVHADNYK